MERLTAEVTQLDMQLHFSLKLLFFEVCCFENRIILSWKLLLTTRGNCMYTIENIFEYFK